MQYPEFISVTVVQAWPEPGSLKSCGGHHLEPQGSRAYSSAVPRVIFSRNFSRNSVTPCALDKGPQRVCEPLAHGDAPTLAPDGNP